MKYKRWLLLTSVLVLAALAVSACGGGGPAEAPFEDEAGIVAIADGENVKVGLALVQSGAGLAPLGLDTVFGAEVALAQRGGVVTVDGTEFTIETVRADTLCSAEGGTTVAQQLTADPSIVAVIGTNCSSACVPSSEIYSAEGYLQISPSCTAPSLTADGTHQDFFMRTCHNDKVQGQVMAEFAWNELGVTSAATVHDGSPYAEQLQQVFADVFEELGGTITTQQAVNVGDTDFRALLTDIGAGAPELIYYPIFPAEGGLITAQAKEIPELEGTIPAGADGLLTPDFIDAAGADNAEGMYLSGPDLAFGGDLYQTFLADYEEMTGGEPTAAFHAHAYDAMNIILDSIEAVGQVERGTLFIGREALRAQAFSTSNYDGITGNLNCNALGDCADPKIAVNQIADGEVFNQVFP
jgi:branched-chain amino acid transport system substrate-binding protein